MRESENLKTKMPAICPFVWKVSLKSFKNNSTFYQICLTFALLK